MCTSIRARGSPEGQTAGRWHHRASPAGGARVRDLIAGGSVVADRPSTFFDAPEGGGGSGGSEGAPATTTAPETTTAPDAQTTTAPEPGPR
jgi:hypothetical protein